MTKEAFCSFEVAKLLKEHGFAGPVIAWYGVDGELHSGIDHIPSAIMCPTHQMALRWLREEKKIIIWVNPVIILPVSEDNTLFSWEWRMKKKIHSYPNVSDGVKYSTYEEATDEALKYALRELISSP